MKKKVRKIIFLYEGAPHSEWEPKNFTEKSAAGFICEALDAAAKNGGMDDLLLAVRSKNSKIKTIGMSGTARHIFSMINDAIDQLDAVLESSGEEDEE